MIIWFYVARFSALFDAEVVLGVALFCTVALMELFSHFYASLFLMF